MKNSLSGKRAAGAALAFVLLIPAIVVVYQYAVDPGGDRHGVPAADLATQIRQGEYLTRAGNCMTCHTARGGKAFAGGRAIATPFGTIYSSNLTPDTATGIGSWTADDFWRAIHNGKSKDGRFLYPAFPYPAYTKVTRADSDAIHAYFRTLPAVRQQNREPELRFPYNQRILLAYWRAAYFKPGEFEPDARQTMEWNRGAYLVQGLGHCSTCHTPRDAFGGSPANASLAGGTIPVLNWHASSLGADTAAGLGAWTQGDIADLLKTGVSRRGAVYGPMSDVVGGSLQYLAQADIDAMSLFLKSAPKTQAGLEKPVPVAAPEAVLKQGARLYERYCAECHKGDGKGNAPAYPPLAGNPSLSAETGVNAIRIVLNGGFPPSTAGNPRPYGMPPFAPSMSDQEIASVVTHIRTSWGNGGGMVSPVEVERARGVPVE